ncbi:DUF4870 domain-containing protein [Macrococcoides canis]|uniref:DUF4870 domain-containing protein n=1 Tax=Macrococcoides canis TaxID=1855823 RepID=UPI001F3F886B|nr:DUF4870 domain-containing protein [Macrococcus canis]UJS27851.1 DUF4870 domain-containing protein [Macrococcus canis]
MGNFKEKYQIYEERSVRMGKLIFLLLPILIIVGILISRSSNKRRNYHVAPSTLSEKNLDLALWLIGIPTAFIGSGLIWLTQKDKSEFINQQGKDYLNMWITYFIYSMIFNGFMGDSSTNKTLFLPIIIMIGIKIFGGLNALSGNRFIAPLSFRFFT